MSANLDPIARLSRDLREAAKLMSPQEARFLVDSYYQIQEYRKGAANQVRALSTGPEPHETVTWFFEQARVLESQLKRALDSWSSSQEIGVWAKGVIGIGPVIAAGLMAHIDIEKAPTVGHIWSFAGLDPRTEWKKGEKRPWNADLKTLCWKIGESFVKVSGNPKSLYGRLWAERKQYEERKNAAGEFAEQAKTKLERFRIGKTTEAYGHYSAGRLPPGHIHARAKRWAVKLFLSHYHLQAYRFHYKSDPPNPYPIEHMGHVHWIQPEGAKTQD